MNFTSLIFMKYYIILHLQGIANGPAALFTSSASFKNGVPGMEIPGNHLKIQISKCPSEKSLCFVVLIYWKHLILIYSSDVRNIFLLHMSVLRSNSPKNGKIEGWVYHFFSFAISCCGGRSLCKSASFVKSSRCIIASNVPAVSRNKSTLLSRSSSPRWGNMSKFLGKSPRVSG